MAVCTDSVFLEGLIFIALTLTGLRQKIVDCILIHLCSGKVKDLNIGMVILAILFVLKYAFL